MSTNPVVLNPVVMNDELAKAVHGALDPEDIKAAILAEAAKQTTAATQTAADTAAQKAAADKAAADAVVATEPFKRVEVIGGREFTFEAESELELERAVNNAYKVAYAVQESAPVAAATPAAPVVPQKTAEEIAAERAELDLKFKRGDISTKEYLEQSGAVADYLASQGISIDRLKSTVDQNENTQYKQSWEQATDSFLNSTAGADWPGGTKNLKLIGRIIAADPKLAEAEDKVAALAQAYNQMKADGTVFPPEDPTLVDATQTPAAPPTPVVVPATPAPVVAAPAAPAPRVAATSSSLFGASSGVSANTAVPAATTTKVDVPSNATPEEILDAWKKAQVAAGKNPDDAFKETFSARRA